MPVNPTYPGVYIQEVPSGVRTITGVATSITAFVGRAHRGPVNRPVTITSFIDFERRFGGLRQDSPMTYAVSDFYRNGGSQAIIVRLFEPLFDSEAERQAAEEAAEMEAQTAADLVVAAAQMAVDDGALDGETVAVAAEAAVADASMPGESAASAAEAVAAAARASADGGGSPGDVLAAAQAAVADAVAAAGAAAAPVTRARLTVSGLALEAANEGAWGNELRARIDHDVVGPDAANLFNLSVRDGDTGEIETIRNVSIQAEHARRVDRVLEQESRLVRAFGALPMTRPAASPPMPSGVVPAGADPFAPGTSVGVDTPASDGEALATANFQGSRANKEGIYALEDADLFNLLCIPPYSPAADVEAALWGEAAAYAEERRAMLIVDAPGNWNTVDAAIGDGSTTGIAGLGTNSRNAALFFPRLRQPNRLREGQIEPFAPCGAVAGVFARTDASRGVWKAPAGLEATLVGVPDLTVQLTDAENGRLNPLGINCLRARPAAGRVIWGSRTLQGDDRLASEWRYVPVRRTALFLEESLFRGTQWVVFEPNDEPLWAQIRLNIGAFMQNLFLQGAFQGSTPREAYLVKCDAETTTQDDINRGVVNILVGFAPLRPAEFVIIRIQQLAGQGES